MAEILRVCHISLSLRTGGLERLLVEFARHHDRARYVPEFVSLRDGGPPEAQIRETGAAVHVLGEPRGKRDEVRRLVRLLRALRPDVVHTHNLHAHFYGSLAARRAGVPAVVHTRHGAALGATRHGRLLFWTACRLADRIVSVSADTARLSAREGHLRRGRSVTLWNGIDVGRFPYHGPAAAPDLITISRLEPVKDLPTLLKAAAIARRAVPALRLTVVGDGSERAALQGLAESLGLGPSVAFLGERGDVAALLAAAAVFVSSSSSEGVSLTLLEAMAVGLPVVATAVGGNPEVVEDGVTGELVPPAAPEALAAAIVRACADPGRAAAFGRAGRARVERHFDVREMVRSYERLYDDVLRGKAPRS
jgi:sugar transferase (PEP-CTERM/EpsH1 system associated)